MPSQPVNFYCIHKPHSSRTVKSTKTAISVTLAIVFMASYRAPRQKCSDVGRYSEEESTQAIEVNAARLIWRDSAIREPEARARFHFFSLV